MNTQRLFTARYELQMEIDRRYGALKKCGSPRQGNRDYEDVLEEIRELEGKRDKIKALEEEIKTKRRKVGAWNKVGA